MHIVIYEDSFYPNFVPLYRFHPIFDLYYGFRKIWQKAYDLYVKTKKGNKTQITYIGRKNPLEYFLKKYQMANSVFEYEEDILFLNARIEDINLTEKLKINQCIVDKDGFIMALRVDHKSKKMINLMDLFQNSLTQNNLPSLFEIVFEEASLCYSFDLIKNLPDEFERDIKRNYHFIKKNYRQLKKNIYFHPSAKIGRNVEFNSENGIIIIGRNSSVNFFSTLVGPVFIGENSVIDNALIRSNTVIGNTCRISGEVEESYISDFSNKHHTGFLGHSYLGEWVNIGAMSTTSDLKNNYSVINFTVNNKVTASGAIKMGSMIGDHVKISIGIMINCGTIIQEGAVVFDPIKQKNIEPLKWGEKNYDRQLFIQNTRKIMQRRGLELTREYLDIIQQI